MTSNLGTRLIKGASLGFQRDTSEDVNRRHKEDILGELKHTFSPEFLNRIDEVVVFHSLEKSHLVTIVDNLLTELNERLVHRGIELVVSEEVKAWLIQEGYQPIYGTRPMRRCIQESIGDAPTEALTQ